MNIIVWLRCEWDRVAASVLVSLGALFLFLGYHGLKGSPYLAQQIAYIASGGLGGIFCLGLGVGLLLSADLHDEWRKLDRIEAAMRGGPLPDPPVVLDHLHQYGDAPPQPAAPNARPEYAGVGPSQEGAALAVP